MGPAVSPGSPPTHNPHLVPPGVCGTWPLLTVWDPRFSWAHRETRNIHLVPPGVCGIWPLLAVWDPRFAWAHSQPATHIWSLLECAAAAPRSMGPAVFPGSPPTHSTLKTVPTNCESHLRHNDLDTKMPTIHRSTQVACELIVSKQLKDPQSKQQ